MSSALAAEPHGGPYTIGDLFMLPDDGKRHELIEGSILVSPPPAFAHQVAAGRLRALLAAAVPEDVEVVEAIGIRVSENVLIPDVVVARAEVLYGGGKLLDPADTLAVVEIASPSNRYKDSLLKSAMYAEAGIEAFWRVEPETPRVVVFNLTEDHEYAEVARAGAGETLEVARPFPVSFDPAELSGPVRR
ncbi:MAG: Uma2 family endonuclease [Streptosporangiaceae bacterium]